MLTRRQVLESLEACIEQCNRLEEDYETAIVDVQRKQDMLSKAEDMLSLAEANLEEVREGLLSTQDFRMELEELLFELDRKEA